MNNPLFLAAYALYSVAQEQVKEVIARHGADSFIGQISQSVQKSSVAFTPERKDELSAEFLSEAICLLGGDCGLLPCHLQEHSRAIVSPYLWKVLETYETAYIPIVLSDQDLGDPTDMRYLQFGRDGSVELGEPTSFIQVAAQVISLDNPPAVPIAAIHCIADTAEAMKRVA